MNDAVKTLAKAIKPWIEEQAQNPVVLAVLLEGGKFYAQQLIAELQSLGVANFERLDLKVSTRDGDGRPLADPAVKGNIDNLQGRRVLVVDDILDSGITLQLVQAKLKPFVGELKSTVLIQKDDASLNVSNPDSRPKADFVGLAFCDSRWFSGVGMDMPGDPEGKARTASFLIAYPPVF